MDIERSNDTTRIVYYIPACLQHDRVVLHLSGASTWYRANRRTRRQEQSIIYADERSQTGYRAYDKQSGSDALVNQRDYRLVLPEDVRTEALTAITVVWETCPTDDQ